MEGYYKNVPIYHENRNRNWRIYLKKWYLEGII
jgi:hypothetical protein